MCKKNFTAFRNLGSDPSIRAEQRQLLEQGVIELSSLIGIRRACEVFGLSRSGLYARMKPKDEKTGSQGMKKKSHRTLSEQERSNTLAVLNSVRFMDQSPRQVEAIMLDEGQYICSASTMYRILRSEDQVKERRNQARHPKYKQPELIAIGPNQVWSWDITKLKGPDKLKYYCLYVVLDIYSRYVVAWQVAERESAQLASDMFLSASLREGIQSNQLCIHADRGSAMTSKSVSQLLSDLQIERSHSRPHVSNDNPYSESCFKTAKTCPAFPERFGSIEDARQFCAEFFDFYNHSHRHSGIVMLTPATVHHGGGQIQLERRYEERLRRYELHPERYVNGPPRLEILPKAVWINKPKPQTLEELLSDAAL